MPKLFDLTGLKFGRWSVTSHAGKTTYAQQRWLCRCECGVQRILLGDTLKKGQSASCGCYSKERSTKHGMEGSRIYNTWAQMLGRCENKNNKQFSNYGGRGITVSLEWHSFEAFYADMGDKPEGMTLERMKNDGNYCKENCQWATQQEQIRNRRVTPMLNGESLAAHAERHGIPWRRVYDRVRAGWDMQRALETPIEPRQKA